MTSHAMDLLMADVLDIDPRKHPDETNGALTTEEGRSRFSADALLTSPALFVNLAFQEAWRAVSAGMRPSRVDYRAFVSRLPGGRPSGGIEWSLAVQNALAGAVAAGTQIRLQAPAQQQALFQASVDAYRKTLTSLLSGGGSNGSGSEALRLLMSKWADRFGASPDTLEAYTSPSSSGRADLLVSRYAALVRSDARLQALERWACRSESERASTRSVADYYARAKEAAALLGIPRRDPLTGLHVSVDALDDDACAMSCVELLRIPLARDGHLWRRDCGGALLVLGDGDNVGSSSSVRAVHSLASDPAFAFRVAGKAAEGGGGGGSFMIPAVLLLDSLPPNLYSRIVVASSSWGLEDGTGLSTACAALGSKGVDVVALHTGNTPGEAQSPLPPARTRMLVSSRSPSSSSLAYWLPGTDGEPFGCSDESPPVWGRPLRMAILTSHIQKPCPLRLASANHPHAGLLGGELLMQRFVAEYAARSALGSRVFVTAKDRGATGEVVVIDNRPNVWSVMSLLVTLDNLRAQDWAVTVFCGESNADFMSSAVRRHVPHARIEALPEMASASGGGGGGGAFDIEKYNGLLKSPGFWARIGSPRALLVQDDGMLVRPGLDDDAELLSQAYVGAPWLDVPENRRVLEAAGVGPGLVGNGGLSLRDVGVMRAICEEDGGPQGSFARAMFADNAQPIPEDVFFAAAVHRRGRACPREIAARFAFEEKVPATTTTTPTLGFHKPWPYVPPAALATFLEAAMADRVMRLP